MTRSPKRSTCEALSSRLLLHLKIAGWLTERCAAFINYSKYSSKELTNILYSGGITPLIHLGTKWRRVVNFTPWHCYLPWEEPFIPVEWEVGWATEFIWTRWRKDEFLPYFLGSNHSFWIGSH